MDAPTDAGPLVSVLLACRNAERHLSAALASIEAQTYRPIELIAVNDGSTDTTGELLAAFGARLDWMRVLHAPGVGPAAARAQAYEGSHGSFVAIHDADDVSHPERLARQVAFFERHAAVGVLGTAADVIDEEGVRLGVHPVPFSPSAIRRRLRRAPPFVNGSVMMRREAYDAAGGFRAGFRVAEDYDLWLRVPERFELRNLPAPLYQWRLHEGNTFRRQRSDHLEFLAIARAFAEERRRTGGDSEAALRLSPTPEAFRATYPHLSSLARYRGEAFIREGRVREGRSALHDAWRSRHVATLAAVGAFWLLSWPVSLTPRARRARAETRARRESRR